MHILFLTENYPPEVNASATRVSERAAYWVRAGHSVTVVTCFPNFPQGRLYTGWQQRWFSEQVVDGVRVIRLRSYIARNEGVVKRTLDFLSFMAVAILSSPRFPRADVVVATSPQFFAAVAGWVVASLQRRPFVFELGDLWPASIRAVGAMRSGLLLDAVEKLELFLYRRSAAVVALTEAFKRDLVRRGIDPAKIHVVINGVDLPRYSPRAKDIGLLEQLRLNSEFVVGYIGTHGLAHDLGNVIDTAVLLRDEPAIRFLLVGDGAEKARIVAKARASQLENVIFVDSQPKESMSAWWSLCDVALVHLKGDPVFADVIPSKIFEAMAMGLPIVLVAPAGEASAIIEREAAGVIVEAGAPMALASTVRKLAGERALRSELARRSLAAASRYSRRRQAETMETVLATVARAGGSAR